MKKKKILVVDFRINYFRCPAPKFKSQQNSVSLSPSLFFFLSPSPFSLPPPTSLSLSLPFSTMFSVFTLLLDKFSLSDKKKKNEHSSTAHSFLSSRSVTATKMQAFTVHKSQTKCPYPTPISLR